MRLLQQWQQLLLPPELCQHLALPHSLLQLQRVRNLALAVQLLLHALQLLLPLWRQRACQQPRCNLGQVPAAPLLQPCLRACSTACR